MSARSIIRASDTSFSELQGHPVGLRISDRCHGGTESDSRTQNRRTSPADTRSAIAYLPEALGFDIGSADQLQCSGVERGAQTDRPGFP